MDFTVWLCVNFAHVTFQNEDASDLKKKKKKNIINYRYDAYPNGFDYIFYYQCNFTWWV